MQIGSQHRSTPFKMKAIAAMQQGLIGKIYMAKGLCYKRRPSIGHTAGHAHASRLELGSLPAARRPMRPFNEKRFKYYWHWFWDTGNGDIGNQGVHEMGIARWGLGDPEWPKTAVSFGGKLGIDDDTETPEHADRRLQLRRSRTGFRSARQPDRRRRHPAGPRGHRGSGAAARTRRTRHRRGAAPPAAPPAAPAPTSVGPASNPLNVAVGDLFYGTEGWAAMSDQGFQAYKGESSELIMEERPERGQGGDATGLHMQNFLAGRADRAMRRISTIRSPTPISAPTLCHLANISYRSRPQAHARSRTQVHRRRRSQQDAHPRCLPQAVRSLTCIPPESSRRTEPYVGTPRSYIAFHSESSIPKE